MLPGMWVVVDGRPAQVTRLVSTYVSGPRGVSHPATLWELTLDAFTDAPERRYVTAPNGRPWWTPEIEWVPFNPPLLPACGTCGVRPGFGCPDTCPTGTGARTAALQDAGVSP